MAIAGDLSDAERRVWYAFPAGRLVVLGTGNAEDHDPAGGEAWGPHRQVRAEVLAALLCGAVEVEPGQVGEIHLDRARVIGKLGLPGATFKHRLQLDDCYITDGIDLSEATTRKLDLRGCHVGAICLDHANINGFFILTDAQLDGKDGPALNAAGLTVTAAMFCVGGSRPTGRSTCKARRSADLSMRESWPQHLSLDGLTYDDLTYMRARERLDWLNLSRGLLAAAV